jgi:tetratricopeptide (TPR) repeat protein
MKEPKVPDSSLSSEILKLTDKLAKDPKSKLFVPLAEEYIKSGMLDEAAMVLTEGLKIYPNFLTARVALGKVYLEKGQIKEAKAEFERVITANPDNLFAHRKLARIYKDEGELTRARSSCQAVLSLNPKDPEMKALMEDLDRLSGKPVEVSISPPAIQETLEEVREPVRLQEVPESAPVHETGASAFAQGSAPSSVSGGGTEERFAEASMDQASAAEPAVKEHVIQEETPVEPTPTPASAREGEEILTDALADLYIKQGYYDKGIEVYQKLVSQDPTNTTLQRKLEEAEVLVKLLTEGPKVKSQGHEAVVSEAGGSRSEEDEKVKRLEAWLDSIRKGKTQ